MEGANDIHILFQAGFYGFFLQNL